MEALCYKLCFVALNSAIGMTLNTKDPFATDCTLIGQRRNKSSCAIFEECIKFKVHCAAPMGACGSHSEECGLLEIRVDGGSDK